MLGFQTRRVVEQLHQFGGAQIKEIKKMPHDTQVIQGKSLLRRVRG
jgi:hypothetical protein